MNAHRYIALISRHGPPPMEPVRRACETIGAGRATVTFVEAPRLALAAIGTPPLRCGEAAIVLGTLFRHDTMERVTAFTPVDARQILDDDIQEWVRRYWGPYVVFFPGRNGSMEVLRAPLGELPCHVFETPHGWVLTSDVELAQASGLLRPVIAWEALRIGLAARELRRPQTCLEGLRELAGGFFLAIGAGRAQTRMAWSPWHFASPACRIADRDEAVARVNAAVHGCVAARGREAGRILLLLSGGLDSSIVAACLHRAGLDFEALNLVTRDPAGDERAYARRVAAWLGIPLHEAVREVARIDVHAGPGRRLPRPGGRLFTQETARIAAELARRIGARSIFNGGGGDNVFCSLQSGGPAADRLRTTGPNKAFLATAMEISRLAPASLSVVVADAVRRAWLGKPALKPVRNFSLMPPSACADIPLADDHPWLDLPPDALPGTAAHVRLIAIAQNYVEGLDPQDDPPTIAPLMAQPIVEACLQVPTWLWLDAGRNRAIARRAFADVLPLDIVHRRSKGTPDSFAAEIFETHRGAMRALLADGILAERGIIEREAVLTLLDDPRPARHETFHRIEQFVDVETWARAWSDLP